MSQKHNLTEKEKLLFSKVREGQIDEVKHLLTEGNIHIDCLDEQGMTPLQHAAYKGNYELCKLLISCGANVNTDHHEHQYSTLMFAGLSGKVNVVSLLLENGASVTAVNSINRTAAQLAAFVGNHSVVSVINNFIPKEEIDWYTEVRHGDKEPKLPLALAKPLHQYIIKTNVNPVRLAMFLQSNLTLLDKANKVTYVLDNLSGRQLNDDSNEILSMKLHHLAFVVRACDKFMMELKKRLSGNDTMPSCPFESLIKHWIKQDKEECVPLALEKFMRQSIREYPFVECSLFQQFVRILSPVKVGDEPSALSVFSDAVSGQKDGEDNNPCSTCGEPKADKKCSVCKSVQYCDRYCQKLHWFTHKASCPQLAKNCATLKEQESSAETISKKEVDPNSGDEILNTLDRMSLN